MIFNVSHSPNPQCRIEMSSESTYNIPKKSDKFIIEKLNEAATEHGSRLGKINIELEGSSTSQTFDSVGDDQLQTLLNMNGGFFKRVHTNIDSVATIEFLRNSTNSFDDIKFTMHNQANVKSALRLLQIIQNSFQVIGRVYENCAT